MNLVYKARIFATGAHAAVGQLRKYTFEPYIVHPAEVASIVATTTTNPNILAAAWLHDVVEDTGVTLALIEEEFGTDVSDLVRWLTNVSTPADGNRKQRKQRDLLFIQNAPPEAKTIKLADLISNTPSIITHDPNFAKVYIPEKIALLNVLTDGDVVLWNKAFHLVSGYYA